MNLPHADYIEAVTDALTAAGLKPAEFHRRSIRERIPEETSLVVLPDTHRRALDGVQWPENLPAVAR